MTYAIEDGHGTYMGAGFATAEAAVKAAQLAADRDATTYYVVTDADDDEPAIAVAPTTVHCECGKWSGEACEWSGPRSATVIVETMPEQHRASHRAAGGSGRYPHNGAIRLRVERSCADRMVEADGDWTSIADRSAS